jgi:hypothetical protein
MKDILDLTQHTPNLTQFQYKSVVQLLKHKADIEAKVDGDALGSLLRARGGATAAAGVQGGRRCQGRLE